VVVVEVPRPTVLNSSIPPVTMTPPTIGKTR
jgi:hypothetical protein